VAQFLEDHFLSFDLIPSDVQARFIKADDLPNVDQWAVYLLFTWKEYSESNILSVSSMVKYWTEKEGDDEGDRITFIIHYHPVFDNMGNVVHDSRYEWFNQQNSNHRQSSKSLKDLLVVGKALSGLLPPTRPFQLILFHEG
jgi:hypothetical protein